jgi:hypothetical protein
MVKKEQGYVGVIRDANNEVLGYAMKPEIKKLWENSQSLIDTLARIADMYDEHIADPESDPEAVAMLMSTVAIIALTKVGDTIHAGRPL